jgi:hypothetical protein
MQPLENHKRGIAADHFQKLNNVVDTSEARQDVNLVRLQVGTAALQNLHCDRSPVVFPLIKCEKWPSPMQPPNVRPSTSGNFSTT